MTEDDISERDAAVRDGHCPERLWPLWPLAHRGDELWGQLVEDQQIARFSVYGLFPASYESVYGEEAENVSIRYDGRTRGRVAIISGLVCGEVADIVIKPCQSPGEADTAAIAGDLGLGPKQLPSIDGFLTEEFVSGPFLTDLGRDEASPERMHGIGPRTWNRSVTIACRRHLLQRRHGFGPGRQVAHHSAAGWRHPPYRLRGSAAAAGSPGQPDVPRCAQRGAHRPHVPVVPADGAGH